MKLRSPDPILWICTEKAHMAAAVVPASQMALDKAGINIKDVKAIKSHDPFTANDLYMANEMGLDVMKMNNAGCSLDVLPAILVQP